MLACHPQTLENVLCREVVLYLEGTQLQGREGHTHAHLCSVGVIGFGTCHFEEDD